MHAIVLVGGFGTRLRPLTDTVPKSMLTVGNEPIITRLARRLERSRRHHRHAVARAISPTRSATPFPTAAAAVSSCATPSIPSRSTRRERSASPPRTSGVDDTFLALNGDVITDLDVAALVAEHRRLGAEATIHLTPVADPSAFGVVETDADGRVQRFLEKPPPGTTDSNVINAGTYVMEPSVLDAIAARRRRQRRARDVPRCSPPGARCSA